MPIRKLKPLRSPRVLPTGTNAIGVRKRAIVKQVAEDEAALSLEKAEIGLVALTYLKLQDQIKVLTAEQTKAKKILEKYVDLHNTKDARDNKVSKITYGGQKIELRKIARKTTMYIPEAEEVIRGMSKRIQKRLLWVETHIAPPEVVEEMVLNGELKEEQAEQFVSVKTTYAFHPPKIKK